MLFEVLEFRQTRSNVPKNPELRAIAVVAIAKLDLVHRRFFETVKSEAAVPILKLFFEFFQITNDLANDFRAAIEEFGLNYSKERRRFKASKHSVNSFPEF